MQYTIRILLVCFSVFLLGCHSDKIRTEYITGIITCDGNPVERAQVTFIPVEGSEGAIAASGISKEGGKYTVQVSQGEPKAGTTPGEYIVTIARTETIPVDGRGKEITLPPGATADSYIGVDRLPLKYKNKDTTPFKATVVKGKNTFDFALESK